MRVFRILILSPTCVDAHSFDVISQELLEFRSRCGLLWVYDWVTIPLGMSISLSFFPHHHHQYQIIISPVCFCFDFFRKSHIVYTQVMTLYPCCFHGTQSSLLSLCYDWQIGGNLVYVFVRLCLSNRTAKYRQWQQRYSDRCLLPSLDRFANSVLFGTAQGKFYVPEKEKQKTVSNLINDIVYSFIPVSHYF